MISITVMAHPRRKVMAEALAGTVDARVVWDEKNDRADTGCRAIIAHDPAATHHLVLQDDAIPCDRLTERVTHALRRVPVRSPLSLYLGKPNPMGREMTEIAAKADQLGASYIVMGRLLWGVAIVYPTVIIPELLAWCDGSKVPQYDRRVSRWFQSQHIDCWYTWPSLVDHDDGPSLHHPRARADGRRARRWIGADTPDWTGPILLSS